MKGINIFGSYKNTIKDLNNINSLFIEKDHIFWFLTIKEENFQIVHRYVYEYIHNFSFSTILFLDGEKYSEINNLLKTIYILLYQQKEISLDGFEYKSEQNSILFHVLVWGIPPLPNPYELWEDIKYKTRYLIEISEKNLIERSKINKNKD